MDESGADERPQLGDAGQVTMAQAEEACAEQAEKLTALWSALGGKP